MCDFDWIGLGTLIVAILTLIVAFKGLTPDVNSGHETFFHAAACLA